MNTYPDACSISLTGFDVTPDDGATLTRTEDGGNVKHISFDVPQYNIRFTHPRLSKDEWAGLWEFYLVNRMLEFEWTDPFDGAKYVCIFANIPRRQHRGSSTHCQATVTLEGYRIV